MDKLTQQFESGWYRDMDYRLDVHATEHGPFIVIKGQSKTGPIFRHERTFPKYDLRELYEALAQLYGHESTIAP